MITIKILGTDSELQELVTDFPKRVALQKMIELTSSEPLTVEEAISVYCRKYGSHIVPYDGSDKHVPLLEGEAKYFYYFSKNGDRTLIDIHIKKPNGDSLCIKQDLSHVIEDGDTLTFGCLIC